MLAHQYQLKRTMGASGSHSCFSLPASVDDNGVNSIWLIRLAKDFEDWRISLGEALPKIRKWVLRYD